MTPSPISDPSVLCQGILDYLQLHPEAADSLDGIATWWLPSPRFTVTSEAVQGALDRLVSQRRIARIELADGRVLYQSADKISGSHATWQPDRP